MEEEFTIKKGEKIKVKCPNCGDVDAPEGKLKMIPLEDDEDEVIVDCIDCNGKGWIEAEVYEDQIFYDEIDLGSIIDELEPKRI